MEHAYILFCMYLWGYVWDNKIIHVHLYRHLFEMNADIKSVKWAVSKIQLSKMHSNNNCKGICTYSSSFGDLDSSEL